jgi:hypothetical protein
VPSRIIREGILTSEAVDSLSLEAEIFFRRLMSVVDDFGLFHGNPKLIRAACYPLRLDRVSDHDVIGYIEECRRAGLVSTPTVDGKRLILIVKFSQQVRAKTSKFSANVTQAELDRLSHEGGAESTCIASATQAQSTPPASVHLDVVGDGDEGGGGGDAQARDPLLLPRPPALQSGHSPGLDDPFPVRAADRFDPGEPTREGVIAAWLIAQERAAGRQATGITSFDPKLRAWVAEGVEDSTIAEAYRMAVEAKVARSDRGPLNVGFIDLKLRDLLAKSVGTVAPLPTSRAPPPEWQRDTASMLAKAKEVGLRVDGNWTAEQLRWHVLQRIKGKEVAA